MALKGEGKLEAGVVVDGGWGWIVVVGTLMIHVIADGVSYSFGMYVQPLLEHFDVGRADVGWLGSLMIGVTWGSGPIASILTNRYGCRLIAILGTLVAVVGFILTLFAPTIWIMYISFGIIAGLGLGLMYLPAIVIVSHYFSKHRAFAMGLAVCGSGLGTFVFAPLTQLLLDEYGWKGTLLIQTGLIMNCFVCGALFRAIPKAKPDLHSTAVLSGGDSTETPEIPAHFTPEIPECPAHFISPIQSGYLFSNNKRATVNDLSRDSLIVVNVRSSQSYRSQNGVELCNSRSNSQTNIDSTTILCPQNHVEDQMNQHFGCEESQFQLQTSLDKSASCPSREGEQMNQHLDCEESQFQLQTKLVISKSCPLSNEEEQMNQHLGCKAEESQFHLQTTSIKSTSCPSNHYEEQMNQYFGSKAEGSQFHLKTTSVKSSSSKNLQPVHINTDISDEVPFPLKHPAFIMFAFSNFLTSIGYCVPYIFLPDRAMLLGIGEAKPAFLISAIGISNTIARIVFGYIADFQCVNRLCLYNTVLVLCGLASFLSYFCTDFSTLVVYSLFFGLFMGIYTCLIPIVLVDLFGPDNLSSSFGFVLLSGGVGAVLGPPMAGWIYDLTRDYTFSFFAMGAMVTLSGAMLYPIPCFRKAQERESFVCIST